MGNNFFENFGSTENIPFSPGLYFENEIPDSFSYCFNQRINQEYAFQNSFNEVFTFNPSEEKYNQNFFTKQEKISFPREAHNSLSHGKAKKFEIKKETSLKKDFFIAINKKRGRDKANSDSNDKPHDKYSPDNLLRKIQVHYLSFVIDFLNEILSFLNYDKQFLKLGYDYKKDITKKNLEYLKNQKIIDVVCSPISKKYKKVEYSNTTICENIKDNKVLNKILTENYLALFEKIYYKRNKIANLKDYGLDQNIVLSKKVKMFDDLLNGKNNDADDNCDYKKCLKECAKQNYLH
jgi:hypothetical protein